MESQSGAVAALILGFLLGLKHATDADHVVAVSTIVNESRNAWRGLWVGGSWGLGHSAPLIVVGIAILVMKETILRRYEAVALYFEFGVGIMLVLLGIQVFWNLRKGKLHVHQHSHGSGPHMHIHASHRQGKEPQAETHEFFRFGKPTFRVKSFMIGVVHGLAGSAAVMLVLLPQISSFWVGIGYLVLFGIGTIFSMSAITLILGVPFALSHSFSRMNRIVSYAAGLTSILFGVFLMTELSLGTNLIPF